MKIDTDYLKGGAQKEYYAPSDVEACNCPLCGQNNFKKIYQERGNLGIVQCRVCNLIYVNPRLKNPEKVYWGDANRYFEEARLIFQGKAAHHRDPNYLRDLTRIKSYKGNGRFLDIGTNMGFFLRMALNRGWELYGVEPSPSLSEFARRYFNLNVKTAFLEESGFDEKYFDVICMTDVFEHITNPRKFLAEVRRILKDDGIVYIKVPNGKYNLFKLFIAKLLRKTGSYNIFDSYEHVIHYTGSTLKRMLQGCGFKVLEMTFDRPIQIPIWHEYVGHYYQYPTPFLFDIKRQTLRWLLYALAKIEYFLWRKHIGYLSPNIIVVCGKKNDSEVTSPI